MEKYETENPHYKKYNEFAKVTDVSTEKLLNELKDKQNLVEANSYGGDFYERQQFGNPTKAAAAQGRKQKTT